MNNSDLTTRSFSTAEAKSALSATASEQTDFVRLLREHNESAATLYAKVSGDRCIEVLVPFKGKRCAHYGFGKDKHDDFILFRDGAVSELEADSTPAGGEEYLAHKKFEVLQSWSNKEFALSVSPAGSGFKHQWLPEHNRTGTVFAGSQHIWFDDTEITDWSAEPSFRKVLSVRIEQRMMARHPDEPSSPLAEIDCWHTIDRNGVSVRSEIRWLRPVSIAAGYGMMFPVDGSFPRSLVTGLGYTYEATATDNSSTDLIDDDRSRSYAYLHRAAGTETADRSAADIVVAMNVDDIAATFRYGQEGRRNNKPMVWLQHRNASIQKLYPHVYEHYTANSGETYEASGVYFIGELPQALYKR
ncbi:hypothetical protein ACFFNY_29495 [Paenibacillus hodogayensis]|uniref:Uncharacterized protein n=1 Tax=Paenibacillus hodogayensis TaxID=279208 RepID=A0ABV5W5U5_9BACL